MPGWIAGFGDDGALEIYHLTADIYSRFAKVVIRTQTISRNCGS